VLRGQVVRVVLGSGGSDRADASRTAAVLAFRALSLLAQAATLVVTRAFYAGGRTLIPFVVTFLGSILAVAAAYGSLELFAADSRISEAILDFMRLSGVAGSEVIVIAIGYALAVIVQSLVLLFILARTFSVRLGWMWQSLTQATCAA